MSTSLRLQALNLITCRMFICRVAAVRQWRGLLSAAGRVFSRRGADAQGAHDNERLSWNCMLYHVANLAVSTLSLRSTLLPRRSMTSGPITRCCRPALCSWTLPRQVHCPWGTAAWLGHARKHAHGMSKRMHAMHGDADCAAHGRTAPQQGSCS